MSNSDVWGLRHLGMTVFLYHFSIQMVVPAITDVTMSALCPGENECSLAIYLTGIQQAIMGLGALIIMPTMGNLSDTYGRKTVLTFPMTLSILPLAILAYRRTTKYFYAYYVLKTVTAMVTEGSVHCLSFAYVADYMPEHRRTSVFGILSGVVLSAFVCGNLCTCFLTTASIFQVSTFVAALAIVYMKIFLPESRSNDSVVYNAIVRNGESNARLLDKDEESQMNVKMVKNMASFEDTITLLRSSLLFSQTAIVAFFCNLGDFGVHASLMYYLKARFLFNKRQFANLIMIGGITGTVSQILIMPTLAPAIGEERLLSLGLIFNSVHMFLYSIAWKPWVAYVSSMFAIMFVFTQPSIRSIISKQVGPNEQGKAQGCITGLCSSAHVVAPLVFSPLTAWFLSSNAPFSFPGFSIMCAGIAVMIAFCQSMMIRLAPPSVTLE